MEGGDDGAGGLSYFPLFRTVLQLTVRLLQVHFADSVVETLVVEFFFVLDELSDHNFCQLLHPRMLKYFLY